MHEISLVRNILRTLEAQLPAEELTRLSKIKLRIGLLSNVEPILMQNAFDAVTETEQPLFKTVQLDIELVPIRILCPSCGQESAVEQYRFRCGYCDTPSNEVVSGTELLISGVELREN